MGKGLHRKPVSGIPMATSGSAPPMEEGSAPPMEEGDVKHSGVRVVRDE